MTDHGQLALDDALARVEANVDFQWALAARDALRDVASDLGTFTADDLWARLTSYDVDTHDPRALGAVMRWGAREGICEATNEYRPSMRPECHKRPVRVWRQVEEIRWAA